MNSVTHGNECDHITIKKDYITCSCYSIKHKNIWGSKAILSIDFLPTTHPYGKMNSLEYKKDLDINVPNRTDDSHRQVFVHTYTYNILILGEQSNIAE